MALSLVWLGGGREKCPNPTKYPTNKQSQAVKTGTITSDSTRALSSNLPFALLKATEPAVVSAGCGSARGPSAVVGARTLTWCQVRPCGVHGGTVKNHSSSAGIYRVSGRRCTIRDCAHTLPVEFQFQVEYVRRLGSMKTGDKSVGFDWPPAEVSVRPSSWSPAGARDYGQHQCVISCQSAEGT
ncbi:hypothetical protein TcasGA2_TC013675 [Tribolium castaneum]|uniref:Uncharacterized protein n=1 Tax=Tribolium castaneum TaxID=7070 RepID=D6WKE4_TRICA|nr:hypothetical protein TcasGA2_TC013675 [Tribolium castaneum]